MVPVFFQPYTHFFEGEGLHLNPSVQKDPTVSQLIIAQVHNLG